MKKSVIYIISLYLLSCLLLPHVALAGPQSTTYEIKQWDFGSGGTATMSATDYALFGNTGQVDATAVTSTSYKLGPGLTYLIKINTPTAPTLSAPANNYDRIKFVINTANNPTDTLYALGISTDNFVSDKRFIKSDGTIGTSLTSTDFKTYTNWGGATGTFVTGLTSSTTYYIRVKARQGNFTESEYGSSATLTTNTPTLTFALSSSTLTFNNLNISNAYTDSTQSTVLTTSTNAYNGYVIYGKDNQALKTASGNTIPNYASANSSPTAWSGTGFGYTTNDNNISGGTATRFNNATNYAGFITTAASAGDPVADDPGPVQSTPIANEQFTVSYRLTGNNLTPAGKYTNVVLYTIAATY